MNRYKYLFLTLSFFLNGCADKKKIEKILGSWTVERNVYTNGILKINSDKTFLFSETRDGCTMYANGSWRIKKDTLILNSKMPAECLYVTYFAQYCEDKYIVVKPYIETTVENCEPNKLMNYYTKFTDEKFIIIGELIYYINTNRNCANEQFETKIHR